MGHNVSRNGGKLIWDWDTMVWVYKSLYYRYTLYNKRITNAEETGVNLNIHPSLKKQKTANHY